MGVNKIWNTVNKENFRSYEGDIRQANLRAMFKISSIGAGVCGILSFLSLPFIGVLDLFGAYISLTIAFVGIAGLSKLFLQKHPKWILPMFYLLMFLLYGISICMGTVLGKDTNATTFLIFMILLPLFMLDYPWRLAVINGFVVIVFIMIDMYVKGPGKIRDLDISNILVAYVVNSVFVVVTVERNLKSFIAKRKEYNEIREKNDLINLLPVGIQVFEVINSKVNSVFTNDEFYRLFLDTPENRKERTNGNFMNGIHPDDRGKLHNMIQSVIFGVNYSTQECRSLRGDGSYLWVRFTASVAKREENDLLVYCTYTSMEDEMKSKHATQAKTEFLSRVSHDMRTPLNGILGLTSLLKERACTREDIEDLNQLQMSGNYLLNLINDTLDVSRIESGKLELNPSVCDGRDVLNNVLSLIKPNLAQKHIQFHVETENLPFTILYIDIGRVEQIIMNILGNAIKFTSDGGRIDFIMENISMDSERIVDRVTIKDTGIGMNEEFIPRLFEPFSQEHSGTTSSFQGTGLGMTITKQIIELMGGDIHVESKFGEGTTFSFTLPMPLATENQIEEWKNMQKIQLNDQALKGKRVLLFEDHPLNAAIATRLLENKEVIVEHAENGKIGVDMFAHSEVGYYDLVLMDIRMPVMDGLEATRTIRAMEREDAERIPIIAMTANAFDEDVRQTKEAGMDAHLGKPIETDKMYETLEQMLNLNRMCIKQTILVVDDVEVNRASIRASLQGQYHVLEASNGKEALEILEEHHGIDAVITDIMMPEMDGVTLIKKIRAQERFRRIVIIANTQYGDQNQEEELLAIGADEFMYKQTTSKLLGLRVKNALKRL